MHIVIRSQDKATFVQAIPDFPTSSILPIVEGPCLALICSYVILVTYPASSHPLSLISTIAVLLTFVWLSCLFLLWSQGAGAAAQHMFLVGLFHWRKGAGCWRNQDSSEPWLMQLHLKSNWNELFSCFVAYRDKYWFLFVLHLFLPTSRLKLVSGKKAWLYWRLKYYWCFKMKVSVCYVITSLFHAFLQAFLKGN